MLTCDSRAYGACPYTVERAIGWENKGVGAFLLLFGLLFSGLPLLATRDSLANSSDGSAILHVICMSPFILFGLLAIALAIVGLFGTQITIRNPATGQRWQQNRFFGLRAWETVTLALQPVTLTPARSLSLTYPASVLTLYHQQDAAKILYMTLLSLFSQQVLQLQVTQVSDRFLNRYTQTTQTLAVTPGVRAQATGLLETRILQIVQEWSGRRDRSLGLRRYGRARRFTDLLTLSDLIPLVFGGLRHSPTQWLVTEVVGLDASQQGLGHLEKKRWSSQFMPLAPSQVSPLEAEYLRLCQIDEQFQATQPEIAQTMRQAIDKAVIDIIPTGE